MMAFLKTEACHQKLFRMSCFHVTTYETTTEMNLNYLHFQYSKYVLTGEPLIIYTSNIQSMY